MRNIRTCSHIKVNGTKCGSPALRHQTLCYFHYHWDRRERRRVRLGGPVGMNKNTGIDFPILEGPESIMIALMEVQHALLDARVDRLTAHTLLYSLQLAMQLKISSFTGLSSRLQSVSTCPELEADLDLSRARGLLPAKEVCSTCPDSHSCIDPETCPNVPSSRPESRSDGAEGPAFPPIAASPASPFTTANFCHAEDPELAEGDEASLSTPPLSTSTVVHSSVPPISGSSVALSPSSPPECAAVARVAEGPASPPAATGPASPFTTSNFCHAEDPELAEGDEASLSTPLLSTSTVVHSSVPPISGSSVASSPSSRPERAAVARVAEGAVSPLTATSPASPKGHEVSLSTPPLSTSTAVHSSVPPIFGSSVAVPCHPERSPQGGAEGPLRLSTPPRSPLLKLET